MSRHLSILAVAVLAGCGISAGNITEDNYAEQSAEVYCKQMERCALGYFESEWDDITDCVDDMVEVQEDQMDLADDLGCDFNEEAAQECADAAAEASCEDFVEGDYVDDCEDVYEDCDSELGGAEAE